MKIISVNIKNLNSLKTEFTLDFEETPFKEIGLFAIVGDTGAGKTTILDAITLALYGRVHRSKDAKDVISYGTHECFAEVVFEAGTHRYLAQWSIWRARKKIDGNILGPNRKLSKWDEEKKEYVGLAEKIREVDDAVESITGLDYQRFKRSVMLSQGDFAAFLKSNEKERSDLLERITGTEVYSRISRAAYARYKKEEEQLNVLQLELEHLKLLGKEELKELKKEIKEKEIVAKDSKTKLETCKSNIQKWLGLEETLDKQKQNLTEWELVNKSQEELKPLLEKLELHYKSAPFHPNLIRMEEAEKQILLLEEELETLKIEQSKSNQNLEELGVEINSNKNLYDEEKGKKGELFKIYDQVIKLDIEISEKQIPIAKMDKEFKDLESEISSKRSILKELELTLDEINLKEKELRSKEKENSKIKKLPEEYEQIRSLFFELGSSFKKEKSLLNEAFEFSEKLNSLKEKSAEINSENAVFSKKIEKLKEHFESNLPENYALSRENIIQHLSDEIEQQRAALIEFQNWQFHSTEYQNLIQEQRDIMQQVDDLQNQESLLNNQVMSGLEVVDQIKLNLEYKREIYEQQKAIKKYEVDRTNLKEGEECPLCLSTEHPFRQKAFKPFVDKAKEELEAVEIQWAEKDKSLRELLREQQELNFKIKELKGEELQPLSGRVSKQLEKLNTIEDQFVKLIPVLGELEEGAVKESLFVERFSNLNSRLDQQRKLKESLVKIDSEIRQVEKDQTKTNQAKQDIQLKLQEAEQNIKFNEKQISEVKSNFNEKEILLNNFLVNYDLKFDLEGANGIFKKLDALKQQVERNASLLIEIEKNKGLKEKEIEFERNNLKESEIRFNKIKTELEKDKVKLESLEKERASLLGILDPKEEKLKFENQLEQLESKLKVLIDSDNQLKLKIESIKQSQKEKESFLNKQRFEFTKNEDKVKNKLSTLGFSNIDEIKDSILDLTLVNAIEEKNKQLELKLNLLEEEKKILEAKILKLKSETKELNQKEELGKLLPDLESDFNKLIEEIGWKKGLVTDNEQRKKESKILLKNIEDQRKEFNRWSALNNLIGSADGKKFRIFAQGLTLNNLVVLANAHLKKLSGRYLIVKPNDQDLRLDIIDTFQADNIRSMNSLSGGESFLVSLSLALGLSDMAGRSTNIRSLFIDEGFGTLDENTLDLAISTLENLQATGKTIGVISHVKELKERISTQIQIRKKVNGYSEIEIVG